MGNFNSFLIKPHKLDKERRHYNLLMGHGYPQSKHSPNSEKDTPIVIKLINYYI